MIRQVTASDESFKTLTFGPGLNILLADRHVDSTETDTRNGVGKSSFVSLLHFLLGGTASPKSIFRLPELANWRFAMHFDLGRSRAWVERSGATFGSVEVSSTDSLREAGPGTLESKQVLKRTEWLALLRRQWFGLEGDEGPSCRTLLSYFLRRGADGAFQSPFTLQTHGPANDDRLPDSCLISSRP